MSRQLLGGRGGWSSSRDSSVNQSKGMDCVRIGSQRSDAEQRNWVQRKTCVLNRVGGKGKLLGASFRESIFRSGSMKKEGKVVDKGSDKDRLRTPHSSQKGEAKNKPWRVVVEVLGLHLGGFAWGSYRLTTGVGTTAKGQHDYAFLGPYARFPAKDEHGRATGTLNR